MRSVVLYARVRSCHKGSQGVRQPDLCIRVNVDVTCSTRLTGSDTRETVRDLEGFLSMCRSEVNALVFFPLQLRWVTEGWLKNDKVAGLMVSWPTVCTRTKHEITVCSVYATDGG